MNLTANERERDQRPGDMVRLAGRAGSVFESFFERSVDAVWLLDAEAGVFVDCNRAAVELIGAESREELLRLRPADLSPATQAEP